jgi:ribokinase
VITDGKNGSFAIDQKGEIFKKDSNPSKIVERTGAGDAYSTGFLAAILHGLTIRDAMSWGAINAASVIEQIGAQKGLLRKEEMEERIKI